MLPLWCSVKHENLESSPVLPFSSVGDECLPPHISDFYFTSFALFESLHPLKCRFMSQTSCFRTQPCSFTGEPRWGRYTQPKASPLITEGETKCCDIRLCNPLSSEKCIQSRSNRVLITGAVPRHEITSQFGWLTLMIYFFPGICWALIIVASSPSFLCHIYTGWGDLCNLPASNSSLCLSRATLQNPTCAESVPPGRWLTCVYSNKSPNKRCICLLGDIYIYIYI